MEIKGTGRYVTTCRGMTEKLVFPRIKQCFFFVFFLMSRTLNEMKMEREVGNR